MADKYTQIRTRYTQNVFGMHTTHKTILLGCALQERLVRLGEEGISWCT